MTRPRNRAGRAHAPSYTERHAEIERAFYAGEIDYREVFVRLAALPKPWRTPEWHAARATRIRDACENCGGADTLTLQHVTPMPGFSELLDQLGYRAAEREYLECNQVEHPALVCVPRAACPRCGSLAVYERVRTSDWRCPGTERLRRGYSPRICNNVFVTPVYFDSAMPDEKREVSRTRSAENERLRAAFRAENFEDFARRAMERSFALHHQYMSLEDTKTFCKKCAFKDDIDRVRERGLRQLARTGRGVQPLAR